VLSAAFDQAGKASLIAAAAPHSRTFLHARPCSSLARDMARQLFVAYRGRVPSLFINLFI